MSNKKKAYKITINLFNSISENFVFGMLNMTEAKNVSDAEN